jgi:hypothetical protein
MPEKKSVNTTVAEDDIVRLKPILGIKPGHYLAVLYGLVIMVILFFVFLYPGLSNPGSIISVKSEPAGAAVRVDGVYMAAAPSNIFVPKGRHQIEVVLSGFTDWREEMEIGGRLFGSLLFPKKVPLHIELKSPDPIGAFINEAAEYAAWTFVGEAYAAYQIPMILSEAAYRLGPAAADPITRQKMDEVLEASAGFATTRSGLRDLARAKFLLDNQGLAASPLSILGSLEDMIAFLDSNPDTAAWLAEVLPPASASVVSDSSWMNSQNLAAGSSSRSGRTVVAFGGMRFIEITVTAANEPNMAMSFYVAETPVPLELWDAFLAETPKWRKENRDSLIKEGLVDSQYLAFYDIPGQPGNTATCLSWHAAKAFCEWYNSKTETRVFTFVGGGDAELRLPTETEWGLAAKAGMARVGEFWEWCGNPYVPFDFLAEPVLEQISPMRPVRGGSWVNPQNTVNIETRGSLLPDSCSPFVSFRPVIAVKN